MFIPTSDSLSEHLRRISKSSFVKITFIQDEKYM